MVLTVTVNQNISKTFLPVSVIFQLLEENVGATNVEKECVATNAKEECVRTCVPVCTYPNVDVRNLSF